MQEGEEQVFNGDKGVRFNEKGTNDNVPIVREKSRGKQQKRSKVRRYSMPPVGCINADDRKRPLSLGAISKKRGKYRPWSIDMNRKIPSWLQEADLESNVRLIGYCEINRYQTTTANQRDDNLYSNDNFQEHPTGVGGCTANRSTETFSEDERDLSENPQKSTTHERGRHFSPTGLPKVLKFSDSVFVNSFKTFL